MNHLFGTVKTDFVNISKLTLEKEEELFSSKGSMSCNEKTLVVFCLAESFTHWKVTLSLFVVNILID
jgi:hypothetical protein